MVIHAGEQVNTRKWAENVWNSENYQYQYMYLNVFVSIGGLFLVVSMYRIINKITNKKCFKQREKHWLYLSFVHLYKNFKKNGLTSELVVAVLFLIDVAIARFYWNI